MDPGSSLEARCSLGQAKGVQEPGGSLEARCSLGQAKAVMDPGSSLEVSVRQAESLRHVGAARSLWPQRGLRQHSSPPKGARLAKLLKHFP